MPNLSSEKSIKNLKKILNGILIINLFVSVIHAIVSITVINLYKRHLPTQIQRNFRMDLQDLNLYIPGSVAILSFILFYIIVNRISNEIYNIELKENVKLFKSFNNIPFCFIVLFYFSRYLSFFLIEIILLVLYLNKFAKLRKIKIDKILKGYISINLILVIIGGIFSFFSEIDRLVKVGPAIVMIGIIIMNIKGDRYLSLQKENIAHLEKNQQRLPQIKLYGQTSEFNIKPAQEIKVIKAEFQPEFGNISKNSTQKEVVEQIYESNNQPEIVIKEESPKIDQKTTVLKTEMKIEIESSSLKRIAKKFGLSNLRNNQKKISEKPIQNKRILKDDIFKISKKKCPFCGKEHEDLNVTFCHACGYKF